MRFASLAPRCGQPRPLRNAPADTSEGACAAPPSGNAPLPPAPAAPKPPASLEDWVQRARGCGAL